MIPEYFNGVWRDRYILWSLVNRDLQAKYRHSILGVLWSILTPLGLVLIIGSVYSILFSTDPKLFIPMLFAGLNPWLFISGSADGGTLAFLNAEGYLKQTTVSAQIFPIRNALVGFINLLYSIVAFFIVYIFLQPKLFGMTMLMTLPGLLLIFIFGTALANISAVINLHIRDFQSLQSLILQGMFYITPIIFKPEMLKDKGFEFIYKINPCYYLLEVVRTPMLGEKLPSLNEYVIAIAITLLLFTISILIVMKIKKQIVFKL